jgi:hypothetical protein
MLELLASVERFCRITEHFDNHGRIEDKVFVFKFTKKKRLTCMFSTTTWLAKVVATFSPGGSWREDDTRRGRNEALVQYRIVCPTTQRFHLIKSTQTGK